MRATSRLRIVGLVGLIALTAACADDARPGVSEASLPPTSSTGVTLSTIPLSTTTLSTSTTSEAPVAPPAAPNGRIYPAVPGEATAAAERLYEVERQLHALGPDEISDGAAWADLAHQQQMLYRVIARNPEWARATLDGAPSEYALVIERHLAARQAIADIGHGDAPVDVPSWEIIEPLAAAELLDLYEAAEEETGIAWSYLAAINLIETGFGRIDGLSTAGAQGPMQFLPSTWEEVSDGDIDDPFDAIPAAARYLVRRGGPDDMENALWGYNNSDAYVLAVTHYANLFRDDIASFTAAHAWEIHYSAAIGDLWFPVGYRRDEAQPAAEYLAEAPWSAPPPAG